MVIFANGTTLETIAVYGGKVEHQNARRSYLEIVCAADKLTLDEAKALYKDSTATAEITVESDGETSVHLDFTLPVELKLSELDDTEVIRMKLAQKSSLEITQEQQAVDISNNEAALIELAELIAGGEQ